jgi:uncharacterized protein
VNVAGEATVQAPAEAVWAALHDPATLALAIPGCERLDRTGPGSGQFTVTTAITALAGSYAGQFTAARQQAPGLLTVTASGASDRGTVTADLTFRLSPANGGTTLVSYDATGVVGGPIAGVGTRLLASAAARLAGEFFTELDRLLTSDLPGAAAVAAGAAAPPSPPAAVARTDGPLVSSAQHQRSIGARTDRPDGPIARPVVRAALAAGAAIGLAGVLVGVLLGRRSRAARNRP